MDKLDPANLRTSEESAASDLKRRLARYRRRLEAEGRTRWAKLVDRAIEDAGKKAKSSE